ncbi:hypothetical protein H310_03045 [Aphanomyces invadans]|uniref:WRKY transcription factor 19 n=1 Tax=Aphanomyces invadans TaxID=157072 RepID=A0A024UKY1_9STRA|nr:hypothetical protein H310_03045 [Aphanomyces invadans]ETW06934.1 hypothetical protein H310_03045 [Aphanomyces invadans]|eukprot:XP_008865009.1 hypothetical protein H310_03045 [Aphanomyces invadans]
MMATVCQFKRCGRPALPGAVKCEFHKQRSMCSVRDCRNQVFARNLCVRHGGKKACVHEGCQDNVRVGDLCGKHGVATSRKLCIQPGCDKFAQTKQRCSTHGGGQRCKNVGCFAHARRGGYCTRHSSRSSRLNNILTIDDASSSSTAEDPLIEVSTRTACPPFVLFHKFQGTANKLSLSGILNTVRASDDL